MIKMVNLLKRNPALSLEEFIDYYETVHRKIGEKYLSKYAARYLRRYLHAVPENVYPAEMPRNYDVIMEIWFPDQAAFERCFEVLSTPEAQSEIVADEEKLFDRNGMHFYVVEEFESALGK
jgi:hypothetical protein